MEGWYGLIELSLVFGVILAIALFELRSVKRSIRNDRERALAEVQRDDTTS